MSHIVKNTLLEFNERLSNKYFCKVFIKREDTQIVRSFKIRGSYNKILKNHKNIKAVVCASAGNHAQGVAYICNKMKILHNIFVPNTTPLQKINRIKQFGGEYCTLHIIGSTFDECLKFSLNFNDENKTTFIHPFDDEDVINGQGTIMDEIFEIMTPDIVITGIGGGGLISGLILHNYENKTKIYGVEPQNANGMYESIKNGKVTTLNDIDTFVDGASVKTVGNITFSICNENLKLDDIKIVTKGEVCHEMIELYQQDGIIAEPAGILSIAGLKHIDVKNKTVVCVLSGGNNDMLRYPEIMENNLIYLGIRHYFLIELRQKPGQLKNFILDIVGDTADIIRFEYLKKNNKDYGTILLGIDVMNDINILLKNMTDNDYKFIKINDNNMLYNMLL